MIFPPPDKDTTFEELGKMLTHEFWQACNPLVRPDEFTRPDVQTIIRSNGTRLFQVRICGAGGHEIFFEVLWTEDDDPNIVIGKVAALGEQVRRY